MKLQSVNIKNFRCFEDITIDFHERLTVLVGGNGSGKSAVLAAIVINLGDMINFVVENPIPKYPFIFKLDENFNTNDTIEIITKFSVQQREYIWKNPVIEKKDIVTINNYHRNSNNNLLECAFNVEKVLPLIAYQSSYRLISDGVSSGDRTRFYDRFSAYDSCFEPSIIFDELVTWLDAEDAKNARAVRDGIKEENNTVLAAIRTTIEKMLPDFTDFRFTSDSPPALAVTRKQDKQTIKFGQLSAGYRAMLALVMDLARRMAIANAEEYNKSKKSVLESPAIVLIDEVDLHLHPSWQQRVLPDLMRTFPNTQFIVTTHSPQVISSVASEHIRVLEDGKVHGADYGTLGAESSRVLEDIFDVPTRPKKIMLHNENGVEDYDLDENIKRYFSHINNGEYDTDKAKSIRNKLEEIMPDDPMLVRADAQIERARRLEERRKRHA